MIYNFMIFNYYVNGNIELICKTWFDILDKYDKKESDEKANIDNVL